MKIGESVRVLGNSHFFIYLAGTAQRIVLEGGVSGVIPVVRQQVREMPGVIDEVSCLVVMHAHFDHVCGLPGLAQVFTKARTAASSKASDVLSKPGVVAGFFEQDEAMTTTLKELGEYAGGDETLSEQALSRVETIKIDQLINEGSVWHLGNGFSLNFVRAPGHSPCSMMAYCPQEEILFCSDSAGFPVDGEYVFPIFFDGYAAYTETIRSMLDLPVTVLAGAHEEIVRGRREVRAYLQRSLDWAEKTQAMVVENISRGISREKMAQNIFNLFHHGRLKIYTPENIMLCSRLIVKRSIEFMKDTPSQL